MGTKHTYRYISVPAKPAGSVVQYVGNISASGSATFDVKSKYPNYASLTAANFFYVPTRVFGSGGGTGVNVTLSYNSSTGIVSIPARGTEIYISTAKLYYIDNGLPTS